MISGSVGRTPYRTHSLGDGSKCRRGKGLKTVCLEPARTSGRLTPNPIVGQVVNCQEELRVVSICRL